MNGLHTVNTAPPKNPRSYLLPAIFGILWLLLLKHLSLHWTINPQYSFGWLVPLICVFLFYARWISRPQPAAPRFDARWIFCAAGFAFMPVWLVEQPNPDWRLVSWALALDVVALSLCAVYFMGGRAWLAHFAFCICLILTAVPWPFGFEAFVIQRMMQTAAAITVEALNLSGIPALQHGNVIEVKTGMLGIDEACSGIRSLQATIMVSLFLGELYRTGWAKRLLLLFSGVLVAFLCNVGRAFLLASVASHNGVEAVAKWHDPAGFTILAICFFVLCIIARIVCGPPQRLGRSKAVPAMQFPSGMTAFLAIWLVLTLLGTEAWYRAHEKHDAVHWAFEWPVSKEKFSDVAIPEPAVDLLKFDSGRGATWEDGGGSHWTAFFFTWTAGSSRSRMLARSHRPEICLPAVGYKLQSDRGTVAIQANNLSIPFHALEFEGAGQRADVFFCIWEDGSKAGDTFGRLIATIGADGAGLQSVLLGERNLAQQTLEIVITGCATPADAEALLRREAGKSYSHFAVEQCPLIPAATWARTLRRRSGAVGTGDAPPMR